MDVVESRERRFSDLYERHYGLILAYARRRVDEAAARDVAAETFLVAWRRLDEATRHGLPWLYRTAHLTLRNWERSERRQDRTARLLAAFAHPEHAADPAVTYQERQAVLSAVASLPRTDRELLLLVVWEQMSVAEASLVVGCSRGTAGVRLHRARRRLRSALTAPSPSASTSHPIKTVPEVAP